MISVCGCKEKEVVSIYSDDSNWAFLEKEEDGDYDVFFIAPSATTGDKDNLYWKDFSNERYYGKFVGSIMMEKDLYDQGARFYAPLYHQAFIEAYLGDVSVRDELLDQAYVDIKDAFSYYLNNYNNGRPIVLAAYSQGSDMAYRLLKDFGKEIEDRLIACYAIGWRFPIDEVSADVKFANGEDDLGTVIAFTCEADYIDDSFIVPKGIKTLSINPLNWRTDSEVADKSMNKGACFLNTKGDITDELAELTGAYISEERGTLIVTDVSAEDYPAHIKGLKEGEYHSYDYQFFYNNLKENVRLRVDNFLNLH